MPWQLCNVGNTDSSGSETLSVLDFSILPSGPFFLSLLPPRSQHPGTVPALPHPLSEGYHTNNHASHYSCPLPFHHTPHLVVHSLHLTTTRPQPHRPLLRRISSKDLDLLLR